jgi:Fe-S cluster biogenesis protein NfuA
VGLSAPFVEYLSPRATVAGPHHRSELAGRLLAVEGVTGVFVGRDFVTVSKDPGVGWAVVKPEAFALIAEAVARGAPVVEMVRPRGGDAAGRESAEQEQEGDSLAVAEGDGEVVAMIKELLDTRIRPAIRDDGGDIEFRGFEDGIVSLKLRGACRTCDSSTVTLRNGIESMLVCCLESGPATANDADALHRRGQGRQPGAG